MLFAKGKLHQLTDRVVEAYNQLPTTYQAHVWGRAIDKQLVGETEPRRPVFLLQLQQSDRCVIINGLHNGPAVDSAELARALSAHTEVLDWVDDDSGGQSFRIFKDKKEVASYVEDEHDIASQVDNQLDQRSITLPAVRLELTDNDELAVARELVLLGLPRTKLAQVDLITLERLPRKRRLPKKAAAKKATSKKVTASKKKPRRSKEEVATAKLAQGVENENCTLEWVEYNLDRGAQVTSEILTNAIYTASFDTYGRNPELLSILELLFEAGDISQVRFSGDPGDRDLTWKEMLQHTSRGFKKLVKAKLKEAGISY